jgi:uncharacterized SAM-binding protein YcdF (DUF218 family)
VLLVPGCRVLPDGRPSPALIRRASGGAARWLEIARDLTARGVDLAGLPLLIGSGAGGEAAAIAQIAAAAGVPSGRIWREDRARTTEENARCTAALLLARGVDPVGVRLIVCTDAWHLPRCLLVCRSRFGAVEGHGLAAPTTPGLLLREALARAWYGIVYRG